MIKNLNNCQILELPKIEDPRGSLTFVQSNELIPFNIGRVYYLYDIPGGSERGSHAHRELQQFIIAISGSFDVHLDDGTSKRTFNLNRSYLGLYICPGIWRTIDNFSSGAVCLVLASNKYIETDYIRDYSEFTKFRKRISG